MNYHIDGEGSLKGAPGRRADAASDEEEVFISIVFAPSMLPPHNDKQTESVPDASTTTNSSIWSQSPSASSLRNGGTPQNRAIRLLRNRGDGATLSPSTHSLFYSATQSTSCFLSNCSFSDILQCEITENPTEGADLAMLGMRCSDRSECQQNRVRPSSQWLLHFASPSETRRWSLPNGVCPFWRAWRRNSRSPNSAAPFVVDSVALNVAQKRGGGKAGGSGVPRVFSSEAISLSGSSFQMLHCDSIAIAIECWE